MVEFRLLGTLSLVTADGREAGSLLTQPRRLALLAYLAAATPQGPHRRDTLLALFWPELDQEHARAALRQSLHVLRSALGADAMLSRGDEEIGLDFERIWCDVAAFARAIDGGQTEQALDLYRGNLLEGFFISDAPEFERWLESERARLSGVAARTARTLAESCARRGDLPTAGRWLWDRTAGGRAELMTTDRRRLAVLPLKNIGTDARDAYVAEGITDELIATLSQISGLRVLAGGAVQRYAAPSVSSADIARPLAVGTLLEGTVGRHGQLLRVHLDLTDSRTPHTPRPH